MTLENKIETQDMMNWYFFISGNGAGFINPIDHEIFSAPLVASYGLFFGASIGLAWGFLRGAKNGFQAGMYSGIGIFTGTTIYDMIQTYL